MTRDHKNHQKLLTVTVSDCVVDGKWIWQFVGGGDTGGAYTREFTLP